MYTPACDGLPTFVRDAVYLVHGTRSVAAQLMTKVKRLLAEGAPVALRLGPGLPLADARLAWTLWWV
jgi:hypothetical protein